MIRKTILLILIILLFSNIFAYKNKIYNESLDFKGMTLSDLCAILTETSGVTILTSKEVADYKIDLFFAENNSLDNVLNSLMETYDLHRNTKGNIIILKKGQKEDKKLYGKIIGKIKDKNSGKNISDVKLSIKGKTKKIAKSGKGGAFLIENILPGTYILEIVSKNYIDDSKFVEIEAEETKICNIELSKVNEENIKKDAIVDRIIKLNYIEPKDAKDILSNALTFNKIIEDKRNNQIIIKGNIKEIKEAENMIKNIDRKQKQVEIKAEIWDVNQESADKIGLDLVIQNANEYTFNKENSGIFIDNKEGSVLNLEFGDNSNNDALTMMLNTMKSTNDASIIAKPKIVAMNKEKANISIVNEEIVGYEEKEDENGNKRNTPIFKEAGIILEVIPIIKNSNTVTIELYTKVSKFIPNGVNGFAEKLSEAKTKVEIDNNQTIVIGGLIREDIIENEHRVPILSDLPFIGNLFTSKELTKSKKEIIMKLTPTIVE